ncbi:histidine phosphatase family protein [Aeromicrobium sp. Sec7.5]|uniref:histidine phosphatase family protein n=1 Tax=Aeromicrobium sp. Sec7.5 TaxID=3121276 RepID=UPI002FE48A3E
MNSPTDPSATTVPTPPLPLERAVLLGVEGVMTVTLVRHGQQVPQSGPTYDAAASVDPPLSQLGRAQADAVAALLADDPVDAVACSPLLRAHDTARRIADRHGLEPSVHRDLREVETFRYLPDDVPADQPSEVVLAGIRERFLTRPGWDLYPWSERSAEFRHRVSSAIEGLIALHRGARHLVIVSHGGVMNGYLADVLGIGPDLFFLPAHTSVSRVRAGDGRRALDSLNDTRHLRPDHVTH